MQLNLTCRNLGTFVLRNKKNIDKALDFFGEALTMASDDTNWGDSDSTFSFAVRELRQAKAAQTLALDPGPKKPS
jgi:hypothetical protein